MFKVYWMGPKFGTNEEMAYYKDVGSLNEALTMCKDLRDMGRSFVTMVSEDPNMVGKAGVSGVVDGILPDGEKYHWTKEDRVGAARHR